MSTTILSRQDRRRLWLKVSNRAPGWILRGYVFLILVFMIGPIMITAATSFNEGQISRFPPEGFSLKWWQEAFTAEWLDPILFTLKLAVFVTFLSLAASLPLAFGLVRYRFPGRDAVSIMSLGPLTLPNLVIGVAILQTLIFFGLRDWIGFPALIIGHLVICMPYAVRTIMVSLQTIPPNVERAAMNLGATPQIVMRSIVMPLIKSGLFAGAVFAFIHSFNDVNISIFLSSPLEQVINVKILGTLEFGFEPVVAAVAVITFAIPLALVYGINRYVAIGDFLYGARNR